MSPLLNHHHLLRWKRLQNVLYHPYQVFLEAFLVTQVHKRPKHMHYSSEVSEATSCNSLSFNLIKKASQSQKVEYRPSSSQFYSSSPPMGTQNALPPTPPLHSDAGFDRRRSPSTASNSGYSVASASAYNLSGPSPAINGVEPVPQRQQIPDVPRRVSMPAGQVAFTQAPFNGPQYHTNSMGSYYSSPMKTAPPHSQISGLYYRRPMSQVCLPLLATSAY